MVKCFVGVDVSKTQLDVYISKGNLSFQLPNTPKGIEQFLEKVKHCAPISLIVCEPTGGYERLLVDNCLSAELPIHRAHPNKIRYFAKASGHLAKTDQIDAKVIAHFAELFSLKHNVKPLAREKLHLKALSTRRQQLLAEKNRESNRLEVPLPEALKLSIHRHMAWIDQEIDLINKEIESYLNTQAKLQEDVSLITSMPGVGQQTAFAILTALPEIGSIKAAPLTALVGLAPYNRDSGFQKGKRCILGGRASVRKMLYMASVASLRVNKKLRAFYDKLKAQGKPSKVALIAVARKILVILNAMLSKKTCWREDYAR